MADDQTRLVISIETILRNLDRTLRGLAQVEKQLKAVANIKVGQANFDKVTQSAQRLTIAQERVAKASAKQADAHVKAYDAIGRSERKNLQDFDKRIKAIDRVEQRQRKLDAAVRASSLAARPLADAHVQAFRRIQRANTAAAESANALNARFQSLGNALRSFGQGATTLGFGLTAALTVPLIAIGRSSLDAAVRIDSLKRGLGAIVGSAEEARIQLTRLTEIAKLPGIGFEEAIQGSIRLQAVGFSAKEAERALIQFSNAIALTGGGREELARITVQLGQLAAKGKVLSQDLRPIIEAAPAVGRALKQAFGTVNADDIADLTTNSREFLDTLVKELERLPRAAAGAKNTFENFRDTVFRASSAIGDALIPVLTRLIEFSTPLIIRLAEAFQKLPPELQTIGVLLGVFLTALGPLTIGLGILGTSVGRVGVAFAQLNALGMLPTIANLRAFNVAATATIARLLGLRAATVAAAGPWIALAAAVGAIAAAFLIFRDAEKESLAVDIQAAKTRNDRLKSTKDELKFLEGLTTQVTRTADEEKRLAESYASVSGEAKGRIALLDDEKRKLEALIAAKKEQLQIDQFASQATSLQLVSNLTIALDKQRAAQQELTDAKERFQSALGAATSSTNIFGAAQIKSSDILREQKVASLQAAVALEKLGETEEGVNQAANAIVELSRVSGVSTETLLQQAKAAGADEVEINKVRKAIDAFAASQRNAVSEVRTLTDVIKEQTRELLKAGDAADEASKRRKAQVGAAASLAREASGSLQDALKFMNAFIAAQPELRVAIEKEAQLAGKSFDEFLRDSVGLKDTGRAGTSVRNAAEQLAKSLADVSQASAEQQAVIEKAKNERLLQENESAFKLQLIAYRQYLNERARLNSLNLQLEIDEQRKVADEAIAERDRFLARGARRLPPAEAIKVKAGAAEADEKRIEAETKILELQGRQRLLTDELKQSLAEAQKQQLDDVRALEIEYGELTGRIEDALNTATDERFREVLTGLAHAQDDLNKRIEFATHNRELETIAELEAARAQNQRQIEAINNIIDQERALNRLKAAEEFVNRAREQQAELEQQIAFDVEFRGLKETEAIRRRLEGEEKVRNSLLIARDIIQESIDRLEQLGVKAPQGLIDFVRQTEAAVKGLGELPFVEQFRLAEQEFQRLNDERIRKIQDVERAVRHRDLAEIEGRILIKKLNGEYVGDLERQAELLRQIAERSGQEGLRRQAADAGALALDVRAATTEVADFATALRSVSIDSLQEGLANFFTDLTDRTKTAQEKLLSLLDNVAARINAFIAENLAQELIESIFGDSTQQGQAGSGILASIKRLFGLGGDQGAITGAAGGLQGGAALTGGATAAATALTTGGAAAATALTTGGVTAATTLAASIAAAAAGFSAAVIAAGAAFAAAVSASSAASSFAGFAGAFAAGDVVPAVPRGKIIRVAEGGYDEAVLTTDPKHAVRQLKILRQYLRQTRGLFGRIPEYAAGDMISARDAEMGLLSSIQRSPLSVAGMPEVVTAGGSGGGLRLRQVLVTDQRDVRDWMTSAEGEQVQVDFLTRNRPLIKRLAGGRN